MKLQIFKRSSVTYFNASRFFPPEVRQEVAGLYTYVRKVDDFVDREVADKEGLEQMWRDTKEGWAGQVPRDPVVREFVDLALKYNFEWAWIEAFWWAMRQDLIKKDYKTWEELEKYIYGSAEVVGLMMARLMRLPADAEKLARVQGRAMQFINFVRDVKEDWDLGRVYLPLTDRKKFGVKKPGDQGWEQLLRFEVERYRRMQKEAEKGYRYLPRKYRVAVKTAADMYSWTAEEIYRDPTVVWRRRVKPGVWRVLARGIANTFWI